MPSSIRVSRWSHTLLDPADYERAKAFHWHKTASGYVAGTVLAGRV